MNTITDRCPICYSTEDPLVKICHFHDSHVACKVCLRALFEKGIKYCPFQDGKEISLENIFSVREIMVIKSRSYTKQAMDEVIEPLTYLATFGSSTSHLDAGALASARIRKWVLNPNERRPRDDIINDVYLIQRALHIKKMEIKGFKIAMVVAFVVLAVFIAIKIS